jgi:hypothetical protein
MLCHNQVNPVSSFLFWKKKTTFLLSVEYRFEKNVTELESSLMKEKEQNTTIGRELNEAHQRVEELLRQIANANGKSTELQTAVQRSFWFSKKYKLVLTHDLTKFSVLLSVQFLATSKNCRTIWLT